MPSFLTKAFSTYFKRILQISQTTNTGVDATTRAIETGDGATTVLSLSDDNLKIKPVNDSTTGTLVVQNSSGDAVMIVDTTNSKVLVGASQVAANTSYVYFGTSSSNALAVVAGTHYMIAFGNTYRESGTITLGTGGDPATSYDVSANNNGDDLTSGLWYIPDNITIDQVYLFAGGSAASGDTINIHLMSYDIDKGYGTGKGDLSNGAVIYGGGEIASRGYENIVYQAAGASIADVDAGKVILATFEANGTNSDYAINITVKYHVR